MLDCSRQGCARLSPSITVPPSAAGRKATQRTGTRSTHQQGSSAGPLGPFLAGGRVPQANMSRPSALHTWEGTSRVKTSKWLHRSSLQPAPWSAAPRRQGTGHAPCSASALAHAAHRQASHQTGRLPRAHTQLAVTCQLNTPVPADSRPRLRQPGHAGEKSSQ